MTEQEAKKRLEVWLKCGECPEDKRCYDSYLHSTCEYTDYCDEVSIGEAIKVAIKALERELEELPSVTQKSETVTEFADRCRECGAKYGKLLKQQPCTDAISRQALIDALVNATDIAGRCGTVDKEESKRYLSEFIRWIKGFPPVIPQQRTGWWKAFTHSAYHGNDEDGEPIWREVTVYHCNLCNRRTVIKEKYCPSCGAKMEEVKE